MTGNFGDFSQAKFINHVIQFCEKDKSFMVIQSKKRQNLGICFLLSGTFTFHSLVQLLLPMVKLNEVYQPISIEYKIVPGLI